MFLTVTGAITNLHMMMMMMICHHSKPQCHRLDVYSRTCQHVVCRYPPLCLLRIRVLLWLGHVTESKAFSPLTTTVQVQANTGKVHKCLFHICYEEQNFNILQIQIQGLSSTFKHLSCFQALSSALNFFS